MIDKIIENQAHCARIRTFCDAMQNVINESVNELSSIKNALADYSTKASIATGRGTVPPISEKDVQAAIVSRIDEIKNHLSFRPIEVLEDLPKLEIQLNLFRNGTENNILDAHRNIQ